MIKDMTDSGLLEHYLSIKVLAHNAAACKSRKLGWLLKQLDITVAVARRRGLSLPV